MNDTEKKTCNYCLLEKPHHVFTYIEKKEGKIFICNDCRVVGKHWKDL